jgi:hypothetical protein
MTVAINEKILTGFTHPVLRDYPSLRVSRLGPDRLLVLDPDNVFWAVLRDDNTFEKELEEKVLPLYEKQKKALDEEVRAFRSILISLLCISMQQTGVMVDVSIVTFLST